MSTHARVLVIDDEEDVRQVVRRTLEREGIEVAEAGTGAEGLRTLFATRPDVVVLDLEMPVLDGWETLMRLRELSDEVGVLVLSGHDRADERVRGLREGADDFMGKPWEPRELVARVEALLRRVQTPQEPARPKVLDTGWMQVDLGARQVRCGGRRVDVSALEMRLLEALALEPGAARSSEDLLRAGWGELPEPDAAAALHVAMSRLRRKLGTDPRSGASPVDTVRGYGYRLAGRPGT